MIDLTYLALIIVIVATNMSRLWRLVLWLYNLIPAQGNRDLVPYFDRHGQLIGMVRVVRRDSREAVSRNPSIPDVRNRAGKDQSSPAQDFSYGPAAQASITPTPITIARPRTWDGWPDGPFQCNFSLRNFADTNELGTNWPCESLKVRRGSKTALTWQKGKEIRRQCIGVLECRSPNCPAAMKVAPAVRGVDRHRQLGKLCVCGGQLRLRHCGIVYSVFLFRGGAFFINHGDHTHSRITHSLIYRTHEPFGFTEFVATLPVTLDLVESSDSSSSSSSGEDAEWQGIKYAAVELVQTNDIETKGDTCDEHVQDNSVEMPQASEYGDNSSQKSLGDDEQEDFDGSDAERAADPDADFDD
ncbi:hypothetical protein B0H15DRAFT_842008 [Mycena belliarum]|uniref:Uncharacterized protein n=1 Tax=Mycena belliarum TaxID=1033014 RepID=A0AAD6U4W2_9AGAR|nr:hypothetical protein B0H15DRAFT_842008 [Mycena belliae]